MKATLATLVCLLTVGFLSAAAVEGNNSVVVIRKQAVKSNTGYQFLCVPVNGMTLDGSTTNITLESFLPAATLPAGTQAIIGGIGTYSVGEDKTWSGNPPLPGGTTFWVKDPEEDSEGDSESGVEAASTTTDSTTITFCGQERTRVARSWASLTAGQVTALMNDSSEPITLEAAAPLQGGEARGADQILVIKAGSSDYKIYTYNVSKTAWMSPGLRPTAVTAAVIAPGEAFYYYKAPVKANP